MKKVLVGMSGGVDSAVTAYILKRDGYDVAGATLRTWEGPEGSGSRCCEIDDAREAARTIGIPYYVFNCAGEFREKVCKPFVDAYLEGFTPNPCVICNSDFKWERMLHYADVLGADCIATGHYASVVRLGNGRYSVRKAEHAEKDQTYMLYRLTQEQLGRTLMPLGGLSKAEVRAIAEEAGIGVASKPDSQEICFVTDGSYASYVERNADREVPGEGYFVDEDGRVLGKHRGIVHYTVGQRRGLGVALGHRAYVKRICAERNEIVLAPAGDTAVTEICCSDVRFMGMPEPVCGEPFSCLVSVRYRRAGQRASAVRLDGGRYRVVFDLPAGTAAPGQSAVFYDDGGCVLGGGVITEVCFG